MANFLTQSEIATLLGVATATDIPSTIISWAQKEVEKIVNKQYTAVSNAEKIFFLTGQNQDFLDMPFLDNMEVDKIEYHINDVEDELSETEEWVEITATDYYFEQETCMVFFSYDLSKKVRYKVTYSYGGSEITDLEAKLHFLLVFNYMQKFKPEILDPEATVKSETIGDYSVDFDVSSGLEAVETEIASLTALLGGNRGNNDTGIF